MSDSPTGGGSGSPAGGGSDAGQQYGVDPNQVGDAVMKAQREARRKKFQAGNPYTNPSTPSDDDPYPTGGGNPL